VLTAKELSAAERELLNGTVHQVLQKSAGDPESVAEAISKTLRHARD
jgi:hypothetical protein